MRAVGEWVQAHDNVSGWYDAKIIAVRGVDESAEVKVHYNGWSARRKRVYRDRSLYRSVVHVTEKAV